MKVTIYELLGMIKNCKAPKKIKIDEKVYINNGCNCYLDENDKSLCDNIEIPMYLYDEVEIIEEPQEHKIPEKLTKTTLYGVPILNKKELSNITLTNKRDIVYIKDKINEIIDYLEEIK